MPTKRNQVIDVMRGLTMLLLMGEFSILYYNLAPYAPKPLMLNFKHTGWGGLSFWDLIQPSFIFLAGCSLFHSMLNSNAQLQKSRYQVFFKVARRCFLLFIIGLICRCLYVNAVVFEPWDILTQLPFVIMITYLSVMLFQKRLWVAVVVLLVTFEILYRLPAINNYGVLFTYNRNAGAFIDHRLLGKYSSDGNVFTGFLTTSVHCIMGYYTAAYLYYHPEKVSRLYYISILFITLGCLLHFLHITPMIKQIGSTSFILASTGIVMLLYLLLQRLPEKMYNGGIFKIFTAIGINSLFIYVFIESIGKGYLYPVVQMFCKFFLKKFGYTYQLSGVITSIVVLGLEIMMLVWLKKKKIIIKI